jgi:hypothetical protein
MPCHAGHDSGGPQIGALLFVTPVDHAALVVVLDHGKLFAHGEGALVVGSPVSTIQNFLGRKITVFYKSVLFDALLDPRRKIAVRLSQVFMEHAKIARLYLLA